MIGDIILKDREIPGSFNSDPRVYGNVVLNDDEVSLLSLPPKFALCENIDNVSCQSEIEKGLAKFRWEKRRIEEKRKVNNLTDMDPSGKSGYIDMVNKTFDFKKMKPSDCPINRRIRLPEALKEEEELELQNLKNNLKKATDEYIKDNKVDKNAYINLRRDEKLGLRSLERRVKNKEVIISSTDKSGRQAIDSPNNYRLACDEHVKNDETINRDKHNECEKKLNAHTIMWIRFLNAGKDTNSNKKIRSNMANKNSPYAPFSGLRKDHKPHQDLSVGPPIRPMCGGNVGYNQKLSHLISMILKESIMDETTICGNTEELIAEIEKKNREGIPTNFILGSTDVKALYPSLDINFTTKKVCEIFEESNVQIKNINYKEMSLYIAICKTQEEIDEIGLNEFCPKRKHTRGPRPEITGSGIKDNDEERYKPWVFPDISKINENIKRKLLTEALKIVIYTIMSTHIYEIGDELKMQKKGGPIGLELTGILANVFMIWWDKRFLELLNKLGIKSGIYERYVDDINHGIEATEKGTTYNGDTLITNEELKDIDENKEDDQRTMELIQKIGDSIHSSIRLEIDYPSKYDDKKLPILDLKVWIEEKEGKRTIMYEHYMKEVSSKAVIHIRSAMSTNMKRTILTQEMVRIMLHCSTNLPYEIKVKHLNEFILRMQYSGYNKEFRYDVTNSAMKAYASILEKEASGEKPVHRAKNWKRDERRKEKVNKKANWYKNSGSETVIFVPYTPHSQLKSIYMAIIKNSKFKIKIVEKAGINIKRRIHKPNAVRKDGCNRDDCFVCKSGGKGSCSTNSVRYDIQCEQGCGMKAIYEGETSYNGYTRGKEHENSYENKEDTSVLWKHCVDKHESRRVAFKMNVKKSFGKDAMMRQIHEGVTIQNTPRERLLNSRSEWNIIRVPEARITNHNIHL